MKKLVMSSLLFVGSVSAIAANLNLPTRNFYESSNQQLSPKALSALNEFSSKLDDEATAYLLQRNASIAVHKYYMAFLYNPHNFDAAKKFLLVSYNNNSTNYEKWQRSAYDIVVQNQEKLSPTEKKVFDRYVQELESIRKQEAIKKQRRKLALNKLHQHLKQSPRERISNMLDDGATVSLFKKKVSAAVKKYHMAFMCAPKSFDAAKNFLLISHVNTNVNGGDNSKYTKAQKMAFDIVIKKHHLLNATEKKRLEEYVQSTFGYNSVKEYISKQKRARKLQKKHSMEFEKKQLNNKQRKANPSLRETITTLPKRFINKVISLVSYGSNKERLATKNKNGYSNRVIKFKNEFNIKALSKKERSALRRRIANGGYSTSAV